MSTTSPILIPDRQPLEKALSRCTHLGIGAHPDDLEIMALHGILSCYDSPDHWFGGITCSTGSGSIRNGSLSGLDVIELAKLRAKEQEEAAEIGRYGFIAQIGLERHQIHQDNGDGLVSSLLPLLEKCRPEVVYTHNPADKHPTHIAVLKAVLKAYKLLLESCRPTRLLGCEVWRNLDWVSDSRKVVLDIVDPQHLAPRLISVYRSQIAAGKQYDKAIEGRRRANATFFQALSRDAAEQAIYAIDMTPLLTEQELTLDQYISPYLHQFKEEVLSALNNETHL